MGKKNQQSGHLFKHENDVMVSIKSFNGKGILLQEFWEKLLTRWTNFKESIKYEKKLKISLPTNYFSLEIMKDVIFIRDTSKDEQEIDKYRIIRIQYRAHVRQKVKEEESNKSPKQWGDTMDSPNEEIRSKSYFDNKRGP